jgi:hypothetical protein
MRSTSPLVSMSRAGPVFQDRVQGYSGLDSKTEAIVHTFRRPSLYHTGLPPLPGQVIKEDHGPRPRKPRRRPITETYEEFQQPLAEYQLAFDEWEAHSPPQPKVAGRGDSMTQAYYSDRLLGNGSNTMYGTMFVPQYLRLILARTCFV